LFELSIKQLRNGHLLLARSKPEYQYDVIIIEIAYRFSIGGLTIPVKLRIVDVELKYFTRRLAKRERHFICSIEVEEKIISIALF